MLKTYREIEQETGKSHRTLQTMVKTGKAKETGEKRGREKLLYWPPEGEQPVSSEPIKVVEETQVATKPASQMTFAELEPLVQSGGFTPEQAKAYAACVTAMRGIGKVVSTKELEERERKLETGLTDLDAKDKSWKNNKATLVKEKKELVEAKAEFADEKEKLLTKQKRWQDNLYCCWRDMEKIRDYYQAVVKQYPRAARVLEPNLELDPDEFWNVVDDGRDGASDDQASGVAGKKPKQKRTRKPKQTDSQFDEGQE